MLCFAPVWQRGSGGLADGSAPRVISGFANDRFRRTWFTKSQYTKYPFTRKTGSNRRYGMTLTEVVATGTVCALFVGVLFPAMAAGRSASLAARCAANLQRIGQAYALWAGDNNGFWPPRCRASAGCELHVVPVGFMNFGASIRTENLPYAEAPNDALSIVGEPTLKAGSYGAPDATYNDPENFSLNPYLIPNWVLGRRMPTARCPADVDTLLAENNDVAGLPEGALASSFQLNGTSYYTNIDPDIPWRGHGAWTARVESAINSRVGPNYNPEMIYKPHRYIVSTDLGPFVWGWQQLLGNQPGRISGLGAWHESEPPSAAYPRPGDPPVWPHASAFFADLHVQFGEYPIPFKGITLTLLGNFVNDDWSLYPYRRRAIDIQNSP